MSLEASILERLAALEMKVARLEAAAAAAGAGASQYAVTGYVAAAVGPAPKPEQPREVYPSSTDVWR